MDTLDTLIAVVIVILILSLIVQSIQSALKKLLKIKSRQIEESLVDLFENALEQLPRGTASGKGLRAWIVRRLSGSAVVRVLLRKPVEEETTEEVRKIFLAVRQRFAEVGRVAQSGRIMLDSIAKEDLLRVIATLPTSELLSINSAFGPRLEEARKDLRQLREALAAVAGELEQAAPEVRNAFAQLRIVCEELLDGADSASGDAASVRTLLSLRDLDLDAILARLQAVRQKDPGNAALQNVIGGLEVAVTRLRAKLAAVAAPIQSRIGQIESWYDTVMQGFEERYTRGMKTWAVVLSFLVVVLANANFFRIYHQIAEDQVQRARIMAFYESQAENGTLPEPAGTKEDIQQRFASYTTLGLRPLTRGQVQAWGGRLIRPASAGAWMMERWDDFKVLLGWIVMTLLLSVGAPFWQDTLESLFGIKNLLRQRSQTQQTEQQSGAGYPRT